MPMGSTHTVGAHQGQWESPNKGFFSACPTLRATENKVAVLALC